MERIAKVQGGDQVQEDALVERRWAQVEPIAQVEPMAKVELVAQVEPIAQME